MTFDQYWARYRLLQNALDREEKVLQLLESKAYEGFVHRFQNAASPALRAHVMEKERLSISFRKKERLCRRYADRLARAIEEIPDPELKAYARFYYLYGLTREQVAEVINISVRTAYRYASRAKEEMTGAMKKVSPVLRKIPSRRFRVKGKLKRKNYRVSKVGRSIAVMTARRKSEPYRPLVFSF